MALTKEAKLEIIKKHGRAEADTGSPEVQIAMLTQRINELTEHLRTHRPIRRSRHASVKADTRGEIPDMVSIRERPASVDRAVPGHWEGDLLSGSGNSYIVTLVERRLLVWRPVAAETHS